MEHREGSEIKRIVKITGKVQGVGFRAWTRREATLLHLVGWVKNCRDGSVEAVLVGEESLVTEMVKRLHVGPASSEVQEVVIAPFDGEVNSQQFEIRRA